MTTEETDLFPSTDARYEPLDLPYSVEALLSGPAIHQVIPRLLHGHRMTFTLLSERPVHPEVLRAALNAVQKASGHDYLGEEEFLRKLCGRLTKGLRRERQQLDGARKQHEDRRLLFCWDRTFLVRSFFTFGLRVVKEGELHVLETGPCTRLVFFTPAVKSEEEDLVEGRVERVRLGEFQQRILREATQYEIGAGQWYRLASHVKSVFSLNVLPEGVVQGSSTGRARARFVDPMSEPRLEVAIKKKAQPPKKRGRKMKALVAEVKQAEPTPLCKDHRRGL